MDDAIAWCLLAVVLATIKKAPSLAVMAIGGGILYAIVVLTLADLAAALRDRPSSSRPRDHGQLHHASRRDHGLCVGDRHHRHLRRVRRLHCRDAMPRGQFADEVREKTETLTTSLLLPIFFVYSGLNTQLKLVNTRSSGSWPSPCCSSPSPERIRLHIAARAGGETARCADHRVADERARPDGADHPQHRARGGVITPTSSPSSWWSWPSSPR